jgi:hypothetical protein
MYLLVVVAPNCTYRHAVDSTPAGSAQLSGGFDGRGQRCGRESLERQEQSVLHASSKRSRAR